MKKYFYVLLLAALIIGCSKVETVTNKDEAGVLLEKITLLKGTKVKHGPYTAYFPDGKVSEESNYDNDTLHGERKLFYENGQLQSIENLDHGKFVGKYQKFYENGQLANEGDYVANKMTGLWKRCYETGEPREEVMFANNQENGPFKEFFQNGKVKIEGTYLNGDNEQGELKEYAENGELIKKMYCEIGVCMTIWTKEDGDVPLDSARMKSLVQLKAKHAQTEEQ